MSRKQEFFYPVPPNEGEDLRFMVNGFPQKVIPPVPAAASEARRGPR